MLSTLLAGCFISCSENQSTIKTYENDNAASETNLVKVLDQIASSKSHSQFSDLYDKFVSSPGITIDMLVGHFDDSREVKTCKWEVSKCTVGYCCFRAAYAKLIAPVSEPNKSSIKDFDQISNPQKFKKFWQRNKTSNPVLIKKMLYDSAIKKLSLQIQKNFNKKATKRLVEIKQAKANL